MNLNDKNKIFENFAIVHHTNVSSNKGGPPGYLYNLFCGFNKNKPRFIFLESTNTIVDTSNKSSNMNINKSNKRFADFLRKNEDLRIILFYIKQGLKYRKDLKKQIINYDMIHVHTSESAVYVRRFCGYKGTIILTPHRPETLSKEIINGLNNQNKRHILLKSFLTWIEKKSYKYCDAFIFPSVGASNVYNKFPGYLKYGKTKYHEYVYTGIRKKEVTIERNNYRQSIGIKDDTFVVGYIGRHSDIKGYDRLVNIYPKLREHGIEVVVAGAASSIQPPNDKGWRELGYISDSQNLINAVDLIVVPNRDTYFDLIILEALSQGKIVITSNTGGNIDIAKDTNALRLFDNNDNDGLISEILKVKEMDAGDIARLEDEAILFCDRYCNVNCFAENYITCVNNIYNNKKR